MPPTATKVSGAASTPSNPAPSQQSGGLQASASSQKVWTAVDAAKYSKAGAFLTAWPHDEHYSVPSIREGQGQGQQSAYWKTATTSGQGGGSTGTGGGGR
ncbi:hypothetical protein F4779DRAFT_439960 [Xylariaceae sp. FL0662B]|nr:hypothetical protein F4779DRAFT_439960 [Xylariaceae sp. FL0662B]